MTANKHGGFTLEWTLEIARGEVFVAEVDCKIEGEWSLTDGDFDLEVDAIILERRDKSVALRRPTSGELKPDPLAVVLFRALDADWQLVSNRMYEKEAQS